MRVRIRDLAQGLVGGLAKFRGGAAEFVDRPDFASTPRAGLRACGSRFGLYR